METRQKHRQNRAVRHGHARRAQLILVALFTLSSLLTVLDMPAWAQGPTGVTTDVGSDGVSLDAQPGGPPGPNNGGGNAAAGAGNSNPGQPGGNGSSGGKYFVITLPNGSQPSAAPTNDVAANIQQCASAGAQVHYNGGVPVPASDSTGGGDTSGVGNHNGGAQGSTLGDSNGPDSLPSDTIVLAVYHPVQADSFTLADGGGPASSSPTPTSQPPSGSNLPLVVAQNPTSQAFAQSFPTAQKLIQPLPSVPPPPVQPSPASALNTTFQSAASGQSNALQAVEGPTAQPTPASLLNSVFQAGASNVAQQPTAMQALSDSADVAQRNIQKTAIAQSKSNPGPTAVQPAVAQATPAQPVAAQPSGANPRLAASGRRPGGAGGAARPLSTNPCAAGNSSRLMRNALRAAGGGTGRNQNGKLQLACTANLGGALSAAVLILGSGAGFNVSGLVPFTSCFPVNPNADAPCAPTGGEGLALDCAGDERVGWSYGGARAQVSAAIPPVRVIRSPFPRGIVTIPNLMTLDGSPSSSGAKWGNQIAFPNQRYLKGGDYSTCSFDAHPHPPPCDGDVRKYQLGAKLDRLAPDSSYPLGHVAKACWTWGDWMKGGEPSCGMSAQHSYETSSNTDVGGMGGQIKANGPRVDLDHGVVPSWDLESYQATVPTYWSAAFDIKYEQAAVTFNQRTEADPGATCSAGPPPPLHGPIVGCSTSQGAGWENGHIVWDPVVTWTEHELGWKTIDLRKYGKANWYFVSGKQYECGQFNGRLWCQQPPPPGQEGGLPVPIIKENPVLVEPCERFGVCN